MTPEKNTECIQELMERVKELKCLHSITRLSVDQNESIEEFLQCAVELIPSGFQFPENAGAKITYRNRSYTTENFKRTSWKLAASIEVMGDDSGRLEVYYLKKVAPQAKDLFLKEERELIQTIGLHLASIIRSKILYEEFIIREKAIATAIAGVAFADLKSHLIYVNDSFLKMWGYKNKQEVLGRHAAEFWQQRRAANRVINVVSRQGAFIGELVGLKKDGTVFDVHLSANMVRDRFGNPTCRMACFFDITAQKEAEAELKRSQKELRGLAAHLQNLREQERKRMAHKIHDELGQELTALRMELSQLREKLPKDQKDLFDMAGSMSKTVEKTARTVQKISAELRPRLLDDVGLVAAMRWQVEEFQKRTGIKCELLFDDEGMKPDLKKAIVIFRILQEALTNTARHARATRMTISLSEKSEKLILKIKDNGRGITEEQTSGSRSFGVLGIKEAALSLHGKVEIKGIPDKSTTIKVTLPIGKT